MKLGFSTALLGAAALSLTVTHALAQTPKRGGTISFASENEPPNLDCHPSQSTGLLHMVGSVYSLLVRTDPNQYPKIVGDLADSWTVSSDGLTYTFKLRPNVKFHDGQPLTSADVRASYDRLRNPPQGVISLRKGEFADIASIETPDPQTVVFKLGQRNSALLVSMSNPFACIYSAQRLAENQKAPETTAIGTGSFMVDQYQKGVSWTAKRFDGYFRSGLPYLDGYKVFIVSPTASINAVAAGQIDVITRTLSPQEIQTITNGRGGKVELQASVQNVTTLATFNVTHKPFDDVRVRRALTLAIDRKAGLEPISKITNQVATGGFLRPGYDMALPPAELAKMPGFGPDIAAARAEAKRLLAEAGQSNLTFKVLTRTQANPWLNLGVFAIDQWRQIGVTAEANALESSAQFFSLQAAGDYDVTIDANASPSEDPTITLTKYLPGNPQNYGRIGDPMLTDLFAKQKGALTDAERKGFVNAFESRLLDQALSAPLFWAGQATPVPSYVHGWKVTPSYFLGYDIAEVWRD